MTVQLTLDLDLQIAAQEALMRAISALNGNESKEITHQGVVIAMDPNNGQILAMVSLPSYDNTRFARTIDVPYYENQSSNALLPLANHAISSLYPPGSVWKLITSVGVIEEDVIDVNTPLYCAGRLSLPNTYAPNDQSQDQDFVCWEPNGHQDETLLEAIRDSCDIYFYQVGGGNPHLSAGIVREGGLGIYDLYRWATSFGIGSELGIELPGELAGRMPENQWKRRVWGQSWSTGDTYNAAFGQGYVTVTPLQLISAVATIANGGTLYQPTVLQNLQDANGNILQEFGPSIDRTVVLPEDGDAVLLLQEDMLRRGPESLACLCEKDSLYYNPDLCHPETYTSEFDPNPEDGIEEVIRYRVNVPYGYTFNGGLCVEDEWASLQRQLGYYLPPFADVDTLAYVRRGMRLAVTDGTASPGALEFVNVAGKTGTAEYCDDVAMAQDLCKSSKWPSHAWYVGYAPYEAPEIIVIAFVYDGGEGSVVAAPIARDVLDAYFQIKAARERQAVSE
jgi:penicillin-binding protein 2